MSSVVISGDTSGSITLSAPAVAGTNTITLPASTGTVLTTATTGLCQAWCNFNGSTAAIRASYNVSSITKVSTGVYTVAFTNALTDANYAFTANAGRDPNVGGTDVPLCYMADDVAAPTSSGFRMNVVGITTGTENETRVFFAIFR